MIIQNTVATPVLDTRGELFGFTVQNNDPANDVYLSSNRGGLLGSGGSVVPDIGILIAHGGGSWTVMYYRGKLFGIALNAPVNLAIETWKLGPVLPTQQPSPPPSPGTKPCRS